MGAPQGMIVRRIVQLSSLYGIQTSRNAPKEAEINPQLSEAQTLTVGLIADTHMPGSVEALWPQVFEGFAHVDCILHAGDLHVADVIDELEKLAPTFVCCGNGDLDVQHPKLQDFWQGPLAGVEVGLVHKFPTPRRAPPERLAQKLAQTFRAIPPQVVVYGHTHLAEVHLSAGRLYVNPGSPTLPNNQSTRYGTVGLMAIHHGHVSVELLQITDHGLQPIKAGAAELAPL